VKWRLERGSHIPLYLQIEQDLAEMIHTGELKPYAQVPSEAELSTRYQVSRMTGRKALDRLVHQGELFRQVGKGTFVAPPKISHRFSTALSFSAAMDALGLDHGTKVLDAELIPASPEVADALGLAPSSPVVYIRRLRLVEDEPAALHLAYLPARFEAILSENLERSLTMSMIKVGARLVTTRDTVSAVNANSEEAALLDVPRGAALIRQEGVGFSSAGEALRYTEGLFRADRFRFRVGDTNGSSELKPELKV
jgi:GntR family transcriptional regulator